MKLFFNFRLMIILMLWSYCLEIKDKVVHGMTSFQNIDTKCKEKILASTIFKNMHLLTALEDL